MFASSVKEAHEPLTLGDGDRYLGGEPDAGVSMKCAECKISLDTEMVVCYGGQDCLCWDCYCERVQADHKEEDYVR